MRVGDRRDRRFLKPDKRGHSLNEQGKRTGPTVAMRLRGVHAISDVFCEAFNNEDFINCDIRTVRGVHRNRQHVLQRNKRMPRRQLAGIAKP